MSKEIIWTEDKIKEGFNKFFQKHGRYPKVQEIDVFDSLPSSKQLQRRFGGVRVLREKLGLPILDYTKGEERSNMASIIGKRGVEAEKATRLILIEHFGEMFVHEQKPFNDYLGRFDFFVYGKNKKFGVDVFFSSDYNSLVRCINQKERTYKNVDYDLILLQANPEISQDTINNFIIKKKRALKSNVVVLSYQGFREYIKKIEPIRLP